MGLDPKIITQFGGVQLIMPKIVVQIPATEASAYPVFIQTGLLQKPETWLNIKKFTEITIITDHNVKNIYGQQLYKKLKNFASRVYLFSFKAGEKSKNQKTKQILEEKMFRQGCSRDTLCLALGGGVVGDLAGFIAATFLRGIPIIQIPTTLLAMVDSSVGGKTAIDTNYGKNLIGAFWQPQAVIADISCLQTLPKKQIINGLVEAIKMALTCDQKAFQYIKRNWQGCLTGDLKIQQKIIEQAVKVKQSVVAQDEKEQSGLRMILNFGHTIGHALEKISDYKILHGYAVAYGILVEAKIAEIQGILSSNDYQLITQIFSELDIHISDLKKYSIKEIIRATKQDKKNKLGQSYYIILKKIGQVLVQKDTYAHPVNDQTVQQAFQQLLETKYARK